MTVLMAITRAPEEPGRVLRLLEGRKIMIYSVSPAKSVNFPSWISLLAFANTGKHMKYVLGEIQQACFKNCVETVCKKISLFIWKNKWNLEKHKLLWVYGFE